MVGPGDGAVVLQVAALGVAEGEAHAVDAHVVGRGAGDREGAGAHRAAGTRDAGVGRLVGEPERLEPLARLGVVGGPPIATARGADDQLAVAADRHREPPGALGSGAGEGRVDRVGAVLPGDAVVGEVTAGGVLDLHFDPLDAAGRCGGAGDLELLVDRLDATLDRVGDHGLGAVLRRHLVEVEEGDPADVVAALGVAVTADEQAARRRLDVLVALVGVRRREPLQRVPVRGVERGEVEALDHPVAQGVRREPLAGAVALVVQARPRVRRADVLAPLEVAADVDPGLGPGGGVDGVEVPGDPDRLRVAVVVEVEDDHRVVDRRPVATGAAGHDELGVVRRDVAAVDPLDAADELQVVLPQRGLPRGQLVGAGVDDRHAVPVLPVDLPAGVDHDQAALVMGELQPLHGQPAVGADAAGDVVDEVRPHRAGLHVQRGQGAARHVADRGEPAAGVDRRVRHRQLEDLAVRVGLPRLDRGARRRVDLGDRPAGHPVDRAEVAGDEQLAAVRRGLDGVDAAVAEHRPEAGVDLAGVPVVRRQPGLVDDRAVVGLPDRGEVTGDIDAVADDLDVPDLAVGDLGLVGPGRVGHQARRGPAARSPARASRCGSPWRGARERSRRRR